MAQKSVHALLKEHNIFPKKYLGQNFLTEHQTIKKIVSSLDIEESDTVLEIGFGLGIMTGLISKKAKRVIAVEKDSRLFEIAKVEFADCKNIEWVNGDILKFDCHSRVPLAGIQNDCHSRMPLAGIQNDCHSRVPLAGIQNDCHSRVPLAGIHSLKIIGNLPYNISSPIIFWMLDYRSFISSAVIMVQREVADRIVSKPNCKDYGVLSVIIQAYTDCHKLFDVSANNFFPRPEVVSSILRINFKNESEIDFDEKWLKLTVKAAFGKRRKMIRNAMLSELKKAGVSEEILDKSLNLCGIDSSRRPETLSVDEFIALSMLLKKECNLSF